MPYQLTAKLAGNVTDYPSYHITFHDVMESSLDFEKIEKVLVNGEEVKDYDLELVKNDSDSNIHEFNLTLTWKKADGEDRITDGKLNGAAVEVYFTAKLNERAVFGKQGR